MNFRDEAQTEMTGEFGSHNTIDPKSHNVQLHVPQRIHLYEIGLHHSPRLKEKGEPRAKQKKAHVTFAKRLPKLVSLFTLLCTVSK